MDVWLGIQGSGFRILQQRLLRLKGSYRLVDTVGRKIGCRVLGIGETLLFTVYTHYGNLI